MDRFSILEIDDAKPVAPATPNAEIFSNVASLQVRDGAKAVRGADGVWKNAIGLVSSETHRHVAKVWQDRCVDLETVFNKVKQDDQFKRDRVVPEGTVRVSSDLRLPDGTPLTSNGVDTLRSFTRVKSTTMDNLIELERPDMLADLLNSELDVRDKKWGDKGKESRDFRIRLRHDNEGNDVARAVVSGRYGVIDNLHAMEAIVDALPKGSVKDALMSHAYDNGDDLYGNILLPDYIKSEPDSDYGSGIAFKNSEVRNATFSVAPFLFRAICLNGNIWGRQDASIKINQKHLGNIDLDDLREQVRRAVVVALSQGNDLLSLMGYSKQVKVQKVEPLIAQLSKENRLTQEQGQAWHKGYMDTLAEPAGHIADRTAFGLVNGLTRASQNYSGAERARMEEISTVILAPAIDADLKAIQDRWGRAWDRAKQLEEETVQQYVYARA